MTTKHSFSKIENKLLPGFRNKIGTAESTEDVEKFFVYTIQDFFDQAFAGNMNLEYEDVTLEHGQESAYTLAEHIKAHPEVSTALSSSDLPNVISRFAETALNRYKHLEKHPEKTEAKIRMQERRKKR